MRTMMITLVLCFVSNEIFALEKATQVERKKSESGAGNGGDGILKDGVIRLLDLVEFSISDSPYLHEDQEEDLEVKEKVEKLFSRHSEIIEENVTSCVVRTLSRYKRSYPYLYEVVRRNWEKKTIFVFIDEPLALGKDVDSDLYSGQLVRIASRKWRIIKIYREAYKKLDNGHRCPTLSHELVYSGLEDKTSSRTRKVIGFTYDEAYKEDNLENHKELLFRLSLTKDVLFDPSLSYFNNVSKVFGKKWLSWDEKSISGIDLLWRSYYRMEISNNDLKLLTEGRYSYKIFKPGEKRSLKSKGFEFIKFKKNQHDGIDFAMTHYQEDLKDRLEPIVNKDEVLIYDFSLREGAEFGIKKIKPFGVESLPLFLGYRRSPGDKINYFLIKLQ